MLIYLEILSNKIELSKSKPTELLELRDISLANQISEFHLQNLNFKNIKLYIMCIANKFIQEIKQYKSMIVINKKLEKLYTNLWGSHNLPF